MALIKCNECGKEYSDKAKACPNCACPNDDYMEESSKNKETKSTNSEEKNIISIKMDLERLNRYRVTLNTIGILLIFIMFIFGLATEGEALFWCNIPLWIIFPVAYSFKVQQNNTLVLTNKRLKGDIRVFFTTQTINIPLERLDNIIVNKSFVTSVTIMSSNMRKNINFVLNAEEFCDKAIKEIEKYKNVNV